MLTVTSLFCWCFVFAGLALQGDVEGASYAPTGGAGAGAGAGSDALRDIVNQLITRLKVSPDVSKACKDSVQIYAHDLGERRPWALTMLDANGKLPAGLMDGNLQTLGAFDECLDISENNFTDPKTAWFRGSTIKGSYCQMFLDTSNVTKSTPTSVIGNPLVGIDVTKILEEIVHKRVGLLPPSLGLCFPSACSAEDISSASKEIASDKWPMYLNGSCTIKTDEKYKGYEIGIITVWAIFGATLFVGTLVEVLFKYQKVEKPNRAVQFFLAFSVYQNTKKLMDPRTSKDSIDCLYGLRFFGMCFVIAGHTYTLAGMMPLVNSMKIRQLFANFWFQILLNATPWVDTFFLMSGILVGYIGVREYQKLHLKRKSIGNCMESLWFYTYSILASYLHRYVRLTPTVLMIATLYILWGSSGSGPFWALVQTYISDTCVENWWTNILYVNNVVNTNRMCMGITWYLANDFQFYLLSPLILLPLSSSVPLLGMVINVIFMVGSIITTGVLVAVNNFKPTVLANELVDLGERELTTIYIKPWCRMSPYCVGIFVGYLFLKHRDIKIPRVVNTVLWTVSVVIICVITFATQKWNRGDGYTNTEAVFYSSMHRPVWAVCWGYVIFACGTGHGGFVNDFLSWKPFIPLGRLTYQAYLIHYLIVWDNIGNSRTPVFYSHRNMVQMFFGFSVTTYMLSYVTALAFEIPIIRLEKLVFSFKRSKNPENGNESAINSAPERSEPRPESSKMRHMIVPVVSRRELDGIENKGYLRDH